MSHRIFITVGEHSGDRHAAELVKSLRGLDPAVRIEGHGGPLMREAGALIHHDTTSGAAMGLAALGRTGEVWRLLRWTRRHYRQERPDLHICVDSWSMNVNFARLARRMGVPVLYYIAPQVWASREGRLRRMRRYVNRLACILPFEEPYFRRHGVDAVFVGHPLFDELPARGAGGGSGRGAGNGPVIGLMPGSRRSVARASFPRLLEVAGRVAREVAGARFVVPTTGVTHAVVEEHLRGRGLPVEVGRDRFDELAAGCDLCVTVSGTATLHIAAHGVPMIVVYRGNPVLWHLLGRWVVKTRTYALVNLLSDPRRPIVPEFIPWYGSTEPVAAAAIGLLRDPAKLAEQKRRLSDLVRSLDRPGASARVAAMAMEMMGQ